jgi:hypothetical protein
MLARRHRLVLRFLPLGESGQLDLSRLADLLGSWEPGEVHVLASGLDRLVDALEAHDGARR